MAVAGAAPQLSAQRPTFFRSRTPRGACSAAPLFLLQSCLGLGTRAAHILFTEPTLRGSLDEPPICRLRVGGDQADVPLRRSGTKVVVDVPTDDVCAFSVA